jgi:integrase/recombinase XerD
MRVTGAQIRGRTHMSMTKTAIQAAFAPSSELGEILEVLDHKGDKPLHPVLVWLAGLGPTSRPSMAAALRRGLAAVDRGEALDPLGFDWVSFRHGDMLRIKVALEGKGSAASRNLSLVALRGVAKAAWQLRLLPLDELERIRSVRNFKHSGETGKGRFVPRGDRARLFRLDAVHPVVATRDRALMSILLGGGLRRAEAVSLQRADIDLRDAVVTVAGKGGRVRRVPLSHAVASALEAWLALLPPEYRCVFPLTSRSGRWLADRSISGAAVAELLRRRTAKAGLPAVKPHDLRRTCASDCLEAGVDVLVLQRLLGHQSANTTLRYDMRGEKARRAAVEAVYVPG